MYVCICTGVTERQIRDAVAEGANSVADLHDQLGVAAGCGTCACVAQDVLDEARAESLARNAQSMIASLQVSR